MSNATYRLAPLVFPSSFMLDSPWVEGWGVEVRAVSRAHRFGFHLHRTAFPGTACQGKCGAVQVWRVVRQPRRGSTGQPSLVLSLSKGTPRVEVTASLMGGNGLP